MSTLLRGLQIKINSILFFLLCSFVACKIEYDSSSYKSQETTITENFNAITKTLSDQQKHWNEGDIDKFMLGYWASDSLSFVGSRGVTRGWKQTLENYKKSYPNNSAMGKLEFEIIELRPLDKKAYHMLGKYTLFREKDEPSGYFSLIWEYKNDRWVITSDHTSG